MKLTNYPEVNQLLPELLKNIQEILGQKLVGLYLYGSAVLSDFDTGISDVDLLAVAKEKITREELEKLRKMHNELVEKSIEWKDRIEVNYQSVEGLKTFKSKSTTIANISPGEPLHFIEAGKEWLSNWYFVQEYGVIIFGPEPHQFIEPISNEEFLQTVRDYVDYWKMHVKDTIKSKPYQGYAVMTMCRALYTLTFGEQVSKKKASGWVKKEFPQWSKLIDEAFEWRRNFRQNQSNPELTYPEVEKFVEFIYKKTPR